MSVVSSKMMSMLCGWAEEIKRDAIVSCAEKYGFSAEEALRELCLDVNLVMVSKSKLSSKLSSKSKLKEVVKEVSIALPFSNVNGVKESCCHGLEWNHG